MPIAWQTAFADVPPDRLEAARTFWSAVTGSTPDAPVGEHGELHPLMPPGGDSCLWVQRVGRPDPGWHLDLQVDDVAHEVASAQGLGATVERAAGDLVTLSSPGGLPFCVVADHSAPRRRPSPVAATDGSRSLLDQICLDIPAGVYDQECRFWSGLTGWPISEGSQAEFRRLVTPHAMPLRMLLQRLGRSDDGGIRAHVDLSADDVAVECARHESLGARVVRRMRHWTTLRDPAGLTYCVTDRTPPV